MNLHDDVVFYIFSSQHHKQSGAEAVLLSLGEGLTGQTLFQDPVSFFRGGGDADDFAQTMVRSLAAIFCKEVNPAAQCFRQGFKAVNGQAGSFAQLGHVVGKIGLFNSQCPVRPEGGINLDCAGGISLDLLMVTQVIGGIVGGADNGYVGAFDDATDGHIRLPNAFVAGFPDLISSSRGEGSIHIKIPFQLQMGPVIEGVANGAGQNFGPGVKLFPVRGIAGDHSFGSAIGTHGAPFVVVAAQPSLGDVVKLTVLCNLSGIHMAVVIHDGHFGRILMIKSTGRRGRQQKVLIHKSFHGDTSFLFWRKLLFLL